MKPQNECPVCGSFPCRCVVTFAADDMANEAPCQAIPKQREAVLALEECLVEAQKAGGFWPVFYFTPTNSIVIVCDSLDDMIQAAQRLVEIGPDQVLAGARGAKP